MMVTVGLNNQVRQLGSSCAGVHGPRVQALFAWPGLSSAAARLDERPVCFSCWEGTWG